jgi:GDP-L-fucose synthase
MAVGGPAERKVWVAGHRGMVGSAICRRLAAAGTCLLTADRGQCDLRRPDQVEAWAARHRPDAAIIAAGLVGGVDICTSRPAEVMRDNLLVQLNCLEAARQAGVKRLVLVGSSASYPSDPDGAMAEERLLDGPIAPSLASYAVAKLAGAELCRAYRQQYGSRFTCAVVNNLYGPGDTFDPARSPRVVASLILRMHAAKRDGARSVTVWGSGRPLREFLHVDDCADAMAVLLEHDSDAIINVGGNAEVSIARLAGLIRDAVGYGGDIVFDAAKPDGAPRKLLDCARMAGLRWRPRISLEDGIRDTYAWFVANSPQANAETGTMPKK